MYLLMKQDQVVVNFTRSRIKNNFKLTNFEKISRIEGYNRDKGRIHRELGKFIMFSSNWIKSNDESMIKIRENGIL